jgi:hypothetical protein
MNTKLEKDGFFIERSFFDTNVINLLDQYFKIKFNIINYSQEEKNRAVYDTQQSGGVSDSLYFYGDPFLESVQLNYGQQISNKVGLSLNPTYSSARIYEKSTTLLPHIDRAACEISCTAPISITNNTPSKICISNYIVDHKSDKKKCSIEEVQKKGDYSVIDLYPGDVMFYKGIERYHWREPLQSDILIQFFMHFVQSDGLYKNLLYDTRPYLGFDTSFKKYKVLDL